VPDDRVAPRGSFLEDVLETEPTPQAQCLVILLCGLSDGTCFPLQLPPAVYLGKGYSLPFMSEPFPSASVHCEVCIWGSSGTLGSSEKGTLGLGGQTGLVLGLTPGGPSLPGGQSL
jgi:hypothetical protein